MDRNGGILQRRLGVVDLCNICLSGERTGLWWHVRVGNMGRGRLIWLVGRNLLSVGNVGNGFCILGLGREGSWLSLEASIRCLSITWSMRRRWRRRKRARKA